MKFEFSIFIPAPRDVVWRVAQDTVNRPTWDVRVRQYDVHGIAAPGTPLSIDFRVPFQHVHATGEFVRFDPPRQSAIRIDTVTPPLIPPGGGTWIFDEAPGGTIFTTRFNLKDRQPGAFPDWLLKISAYVDTWRSLRKLRRRVAQLKAPQELSQTG